jgi:hypothetical protein
MVSRFSTALVVLAVLLVAGCGSGADLGREPPVPPLTTRPAPGSPAPTAGPEGLERGLPVYYVAETDAGLRLQRELHRVRSTDPASDAVREMLANPTGTDPDYRNPWPSGTTLRTPVTVDDAIVVDLAGAQAGPVVPELAEAAVQQLVFTVQGALQSSDPVRILVDGRPIDRLWDAVDTSVPVERGDDYALRSLVQIDSPAHGATVGAPVEVTGEAAVFEATVRWQVLRDGAVVRSGFTSTTEGQRFAPYTFEVDLAPGEYTVRVLEDDPSGGEGRPVLSDDKAVTVTGGSSRTGAPRTGAPFVQPWAGA